MLPRVSFDLKKNVTFQDSSTEKQKYESVIPCVFGDIGKLENKMLHCWCAIRHFLSPSQNLQPIMDQDAIRCHIIITRGESNMQCQTGEGNVFNLYRLTTSFTSTSISLPGSGGCLRRSFKALRSACANLAESRRLLRPDRPPAKANFIETAPRLHHRSHSRIEGSFNTNGI